MKKIGIEEHWRIGGKDREYQVEERLKDMDQSGIDMQVISSGLAATDRLSPAEATAKSKMMNEEFFKITTKYPERFAAFSVISLRDPDAGARELERTVKEFNFKGTLIGQEVPGDYLDMPKYSGFLETVQKLEVPIYVHPSRPAPDMIGPYLTYPILSRSMWGFAAEAGLHAMRLICSGTFDKYPDLKIIIGHLGESIPFQLWRLDNRWRTEKDGWQSVEPDPIASKLEKKPSQYFKDNFYVTTSGMFWGLALQFVCLAIGADRVLFAVDYPAETNEVAVSFIDSAPISDNDKEKICHLNVEKLLRL